MTREEKNLKIKKSMIATHEKRNHQSCHVYKIKIDESSLTKIQKEQLKMIFVEGKWIVNDCLSWTKENNENKPWNYKIGKIIKHLNKDKEVIESELKYISSQMKQSVISEIVSNIRTLSSLKKNDSKIGALKFRSELKEINLKQYNNTYKILSKNKIQIQNIKGSIRVNGLKQFIDTPNIEYANAKILNTPNGYYVAITTYVTKYKNNAKINDTIGIDFGCSTSFTLSNGEKINCSIEESDRLKKLQKSLKRKEKSSNNRAKTIAKIKKEYQHLTNKKNDIANKIVSKLNDYKEIIIQDEQLQNWHKSNHGKAIQHSVLGRVKSKLLKNDNTKIISKWLPSTKLCINCGKIHDEMTVKDRIFICQCGVKQDRDIHAANNIIWLYKNKVGEGLTKLTRVEIQKQIDEIISSKNESMKHEDSTL